MKIKKIIVDDTNVEFILRGPYYGRKCVFMKLKRMAKKQEVNIWLR